MPLAALLLAATALAGDPVAGIAPGMARPVIVRGGVLVLPLVAAHAGDRWPSSVALRFEDGESIDAAVVWMSAAPAPMRRRWTDDPSALAVRPIAPTDDTTAPADGGAPYAVVALPLGRGGDFVVVDPRASAAPSSNGAPPVPVRPHWVEPSSLASMAPRDDQPMLQRREETSLPDPTSPFDHWRWMLVAQRRGLRPPAPPGDGLETLIAQHGAQMWTVGMARLAAQSEGVAAACREALTQTCVDGDRSIGAWVTDPVETGALLTLLLDFNRRDRAVMDAALAWSDSRAPLVLWTEQEQGGLVTIAAANALPAPVEAVARWASGAAAPTTRTVRGGELARLHVARPSQLPGEPLARRDPREAPLVLVIEGDGHRRDVSVGPAVAFAEPPGVPLPVFRPPLRLSEARAGAQRAVDRSRTTAGMLRRTQGRWELFIECARPTAPGAPDAASPSDGALPIGREAIVVALGPRDAPSVVLVVPEAGAPWIVEGDAAVEARIALRTAERLRAAAMATVAPGEGAAGGRADPGPGASAPPRGFEIVRRSLPTLWRCRIVLPKSWLPARDGESLLLGVARTHGGDEAIETAGLPQVPWDLWPAPTAIDLSRWDE
ncbi:MAG: hypothetical protein U0575_14675 [Phycisphaerales bacterium]